MTAHIHAALMALYAQDALETDKPWERWEHRAKGSQEAFRAAQSLLAFFPASEYRRKPKTIQIGDMQVPEPMRVAPAKGAKYWRFNLLYPNNPTEYVWDGLCVGLTLLKHGMVHATHEGAILHVKALIKVSGGSCEGEGT